MNDPMTAITLVGDLGRCALCSAPFPSGPIQVQPVSAFGSCCSASGYTDSDWRFFTLSPHIYPICPAHFPDEYDEMKYAHAVAFIVRRLSARACCVPIH